MSNVESLEIITPSELEWLQKDFQQRIETEGVDREIDSVDAYLIWHRPNLRVIDRRVTFAGSEPAYNLVKTIVQRRIPDANVYCAYQRQYLPHHVHVDDITIPEGADKSRYCSFVIPLMEDPSFKTFVWTKEFQDSTDLEHYRNYFRNNQELFSPVNNLSSEHWLDHCSCSRAPEFVDCHELDGYYEYRLGTVGKFPRIQMHASNNWLRSGQYTHKDLVIVHVH